MKKWKRALLFLLMLPAAYVLINIQLVVYGLQQLKGQLSIIYNAEPVEHYLKDARFPESHKKKLHLIEAVRKYAMDSLGLKNSKNYTTLYDQKDQPVLWVLTACPPFSMDPYEWKFPFLGEVAYKGFFQKQKGLAEEKKFKEHFYDTDFSPAGGWSTLGFFRDPILSNMLKRSDGNLAELIIHELSHATLYIPGSVEFNENFATFVGEEGAVKFLAYYYGADSQELTDYIYSREDEETFGEYMVEACSRLDSLYKSFNDESFGEKLRKKSTLIRTIVSGINDLPLHNPKRYKFRYPENKLPDNTWFLSYKRYRGRQDQFAKELQDVNGNLSSFIQSMKSGKVKSD